MVGYCFEALASVSVLGSLEPLMFFIFRACHAIKQQQSVMHAILMMKTRMNRTKFRV